MPGLPRVSFDRIAHCYDETRTLPAPQMDAIMDALVDALSACDRVLEVGVGTGRFGVPLQQRGIRLVGLDIAPGMIARGREKGLRDVLLGDALTLPFRNAAFDAALSVHVLHLLPDWRVALAEFARVARDSYYTVATTWKNGRSPHRVYWDFIQASGYGRPRQGVFERDLPDHVPPRERTPIGTFSEEREATDALDALANRVYSGQWNIPEDFHREAVRAARRAFPEGTLHFEKTVDLLRWDARDLRSR
ncbi:MAG: class I SAM-dependent methyltransferase [Thermoplasmata archaeon]